MVNTTTRRSRPNGPAIEIRNVSKKFKLFSDRRTNLKEMFTERRRKDKSDDFWALKDISFDIPRGKTFGLIGHNGSGKSTLLKLVAGIHRPSDGTVTTHGRISAMLELGAGFHPELSGRENIYLNGSILGLTRKQIDAAMEQIIEFSGLREFIETPVKVYSSGMYVRLGFAIAVNLDPEILIIDEVIAVGDEEFQRKCFDHLYELRRTGTTIVLVSHSLGLVADLCDQVAWIDNGKLMGVGEARPLIDKYLASVNDKETHVGDLHPGHETSERDVNATRTGSGEIQVSGVDYIDESGAPVPFMTTGRPCTVRINYESTIALPEVTFGLGFVHEAGIEVAGPNSGASQTPLFVLPGRGAIDYHLDRVPMLPGTYALSTIIADKGHIYEHRDRSFIAKVRSDRVVTESGLVAFDGRWSVAGSATLATAELSERSASKPR